MNFKDISANGDGGALLLISYCGREKDEYVILSQSTVQFRYQGKKFLSTQVISKCGLCRKICTHLKIGPKATIYS